MTGINALFVNAQTYSTIMSFTDHKSVVAISVSVDEEDWQVKFISYLNSKECKEFEHKVKKKVEYIYKCCMKRGDKNWLKKE